LVQETTTENWGTGNMVFIWGKYCNHFFKYVVVEKIYKNPSL